MGLGLAQSQAQNRPSSLCINHINNNNLGAGEGHARSIPAHLLPSSSGSDLSPSSRKKNIKVEVGTDIQEWVVRAMIRM